MAGYGSKAVMVLETGEVFASRKAAAEHFGITTAEVWFLIDYRVSPKGTNLHLVDMESYMAGLSDNGILMPDSGESGIEQDKDATILGLCQTVRDRDAEIASMKSSHAGTVANLKSELEQAEQRLREMEGGWFLSEDSFQHLDDFIDAETRRAEEAERKFAKREEDIRQAAALTGNLLKLTEAHLEATYTLSAQLRNLFCEEEQKSE